MAGRKLGGLLIMLGIAAAISACGSDDDSKANTGGNGGKGGAGAGGTGGKATGGTSSGGTSSGGTSSGGTSSGGSSGSGTGGGTGATGGIAAKYPGDVGIGNDPDVIFADDFESYVDQTNLWDRWDN